MCEVVSIVVFKRQRDIWKCIHTLSHEEWLNRLPSVCRLISPHPASIKASNTAESGSNNGHITREYMHAHTQGLSANPFRTFHTARRAYYWAFSNAYTRSVKDMLHYSSIHSDTVASCDINERCWMCGGGSSGSTACLRSKTASFASVVRLVASLPPEWPYCLFFTFIHSFNFHSI